MGLNLYYKHEDDVLSVRELEVTLYKDETLKVPYPDDYELDFRLDSAVAIWKHGESRRNKITLHKTFKENPNLVLPGLAPWDYHLYSITVRGEKRYFISSYCLPELKAYTTILNHYRVSYIWTNPYHVLKKLRLKAEEEERVRVKKWNEEKPLREAKWKAEENEKKRKEIIYYSLIIISFLSMLMIAKFGIPWKGAMVSMGSIIISRFFDESDDNDEDKHFGVIFLMIIANIIRVIIYGIFTI
jgi:hypothetical protein